MRIEEVTIIRAPIERCFDLARSVEVHLAGNVHWGEAAVAPPDMVAVHDAARPFVRPVDIAACLLAAAPPGMMGRME